MGSWFKKSQGIDVCRLASGLGGGLETRLLVRLVRLVKTTALLVSHVASAAGAEAERQSEGSHSGAQGRWCWGQQKL